MNEPVACCNCGSENWVPGFTDRGNVESQRVECEDCGVAGPWTYGEFESWDAWNNFQSRLSPPGESR